MLCWGVNVGYVWELCGWLPDCRRCHNCMPVRQQLLLLAKLWSWLQLLLMMM